MSQLEAQRIRWDQWARAQLERYAVEWVDERTDEGKARALLIRTKANLTGPFRAIVLTAWGHVGLAYGTTNRSGTDNRMAIWLAGLFVRAGCRLIALARGSLSPSDFISFLKADRDDTPTDRQTTQVMEQIARLVLQVGFQRAVAMVEATKEPQHARP